MRRILGDRGLLVVTHDIEHVEEIAVRFRDAGVGVVGVVGGDGTAGVAVQAFSDVYGAEALPPFALLRGGTMNTVANGLGLARHKPERNLRRLLARTAGGVVPPSVERRTIVAGGRCGFLFGTGVFRSFLDAYYAAGHDDPSAVTAVRTIARLAASAFVQGPLIKRLGQPLRAVVEVDGERWPERDYLTHAIGTVPQVGLGFTPFYMADDHPDAFHFLAVHGRTFDVAADLWRVWLGRPLRPANATGVVAREVAIHAHEDRVAYMVDGDLYTCDGPLRVTTGPAARIVT